MPSKKRYFQSSEEQSSDFTNLDYEEAKSNCKTIEDVTSVVQAMTKDLFQQIFEGELTEHLGYDKGKTPPTAVSNRRNGTYSKKVKSNLGNINFDIPRDREGTYDPQIVKKGQTDINEIDTKILSMYAKGMSTRDMEETLNDIYGIEVSKSMISTVTDKIFPEITRWQSSPLEKKYAIVYLDCIHFKVRNKNSVVISKPFYIVMGVSLEGYKEILGIWTSENESSSFWLSVLTDLQNRGVEDILITCVDGLTGFPDAIRSIFPNTDVQRCIIHQIRNTFKYVSWKDRKELGRDMAKIYKSSTKELAEEELFLFEKKWSDKYNVVVKSWINNWDELSAYFKYSKYIRKIIYTTNTIESFNRQLRKVAKTKGALPSDKSAIKLIYLITQDVSKKWNRISNWGLIISQLAIHFEERFELDLKY